MSSPRERLLKSFILAIISSLKNLKTATALRCPTWIVVVCAMYLGMYWLNYASCGNETVYSVLLLLLLHKLLGKPEPLIEVPVYL